MNNCESRVYGSYGDGETAAVAGTGIVQGAARESLAPLRSQRLDESLRTLADKLNHALLWVLEIMTVISLVAFAMLLLKAESWKPLVALMVIVGYSTVAACMGVYLILIKRGALRNR